VRLLSLELRNYRNYGRLHLEPGPRLNVFFGANGQGKTNLLESVALLALSTSPRARKESELVGPAAAETRIGAFVEGGGRRSEIRITINVEGDRARRRIEVDGRPRRAVDLPGLFRATLFWPDDLNLVKAGPEHRRRLLNEMLVQVRPGYARTLSRYQRVLLQRNALLKQVSLGEQQVSFLDVWDPELARLGGELAEARRHAVGALSVIAPRGHAALSGGEALEVEYTGPPADLLQALQAGRRDDVRRGSTSVGPHRDDVLIRIDGREARAFASQGQQRTAVVSIKLAEAAVVAEMTGEQPVLLLDDVLSELDAGRRRALLERVGHGGQVIITSVEADPFPAGVIGSSQVMCIERGLLKSCGQAE
jgi:DNA replication and repair protein RecF